jgi:hypothetical protein
MTLTYEDFDKMFKDERGNIPHFDYICQKDLGIIGNPKANKLMAYAWQEGHSSGYYEVYQIARELVDLIKYNDGPFRIVNTEECVKEIRYFMNNPDDVCNCIERHTFKELPAEEDA